MDLGIAGKRALVCAASKGLGRGCAQALADAGCDVTIVARTEDVLRRTAEEIGAKAGRAVRWVACDITTPEGRAAALAAVPEPDILINNAGGPPPGDFRDWDRAAWIRALDANMLTPIELIKATVDGMIARRFGRIVNITSSVGEGADRHPRTVQRRALRTHRLRRRARAQGRGPQRDDQQSAARLLRHRPAARRRWKRARRPPASRWPKCWRRAPRPFRPGRFGQRDEFGAVCAFLCSVHAGYIVGQNILQDGGNYPGTF